MQPDIIDIQLGPLIPFLKNSPPIDRTAPSLKGGERSDGEDDVDDAGDEGAGGDPPQDRQRISVGLEPN